MSVTDRALWYIETHLGEELSLDTIGGAIGVSRFHLCRAFAGSMGEPPAGYVRGRRLSEAAKALGRGAPDILTVALEAGYNSHEAFPRASRQLFGLTPEQGRARACVKELRQQEAVRMNETKTAAIGAPRMVDGGPLALFGLSEKYRGDAGAGIPSQWSRFLQHFGHIPNQVGGVAYGVVYNFDQAGGYEYLCAVEVSGKPDHPEGFVMLRIAPQRYAVFRHREHISSIQASWKEVWERGLAEAGCKAKEAPVLERYGEVFDGRPGLGGVELWVPVQE